MKTKLFMVAGMMIAASIGTINAPFIIKNFTFMRTFSYSSPETIIHTIKLLYA
jgi:hypothetical protein